MTETGTVVKIMMYILQTRNMKKEEEREKEKESKNLTWLKTKANVIMRPTSLVFFLSEKLKIERTLRINIIPTITGI